MKLESHLSNGEIEVLLQRTLTGKAIPEVDREVFEKTQNHLNSCRFCQLRLQTQKETFKQFAQLKLDTPAESGKSCPPADLWTEVAAGIATPETEAALEHASNCDHCGPLLRQAGEELVEELTPEEEARIGKLQSSNPVWQQALAEKLSRMGVQKAVKPRPGWIPEGFAIFLRPSRIALGASIIAVVASGIWFSLRLETGPSPERLIADAYREKRTIEVRIAGAPYVPLRQERGNEPGFMSRPAWLKASAEIAKRLAAHPDDIAWLQASGRVSLLQGDEDGTEAALRTLEKAHRLDPNNASISTDLASAFIVRGQLLHRDGDFADAIEILKKEESSHRGDEVAEYNLALALEGLGCKHDAAAVWQKFLTNSAKSAWAPEAQEHLSRLQQTISQRDRRSDAPLRTLQQVANAFRNNDSNTIESIEGRIEEYQDLALESWLPILFHSNGPNSRDIAFAEPALRGLSQLLVDRNGDPWLKDFLDANRSSPMLSKAIGLLAESAVKIETSDESSAKIEASEARDIFELSHVRAGETRARLILILVEQYEHRDAPCEAMALAMLHDQTLQRYPWLHGQILLEDGFCASLSDKQSLQAAQSARQIAESHHFPNLFLRATAAESGLYSVLGDTDRAWSSASAGFHAFWIGTAPRLRGYNALIGMDEILSQQDKWYLRSAVLEEAMPLVDGDPRTTMVAVGEARLGETLMHTGDLDGAERCYRQVQFLMNESSPGPQRTSLRAESDLGLAKVDLNRNHLTAALNRLGLIRPVFTQLPDDLLVLDFYQTSGIAQLRADHLAEAEKDLNAAVEIAEKGLRKVDGESDRWKWSHQNEPIYRALVNLQLRTDPKSAFFEWEWYKGAPLRNEGRQPALKPIPLVESSDLPDKNLHLPDLDENSALISFISFSDGYRVWVWDQSGLRSKWIPFDLNLTSLLAAQFTEQCSDPGSDLSSLRNEGMALYRTFFLPIEPWITTRHRLIIEPDGAMKSLPLDLLIDSHGEYFGDRFAITISPGIAYLNRSREWSKVMARSKTFILGDPKVAGWMPLPDAEEEARSVASLFTSPHLFIQESLSAAEFQRELATADVFHFSGHAMSSVGSVALVTGTSETLDSKQMNLISHGGLQMVVISACSSLGGARGLFDDDDSLVRRLMGARVPVVVASRWMVDSAATSVLMKEFYSELTRGKTPSEALSAARRTVRTKQEFSHPYYWASFSVFGRS